MTSTAHRPQLFDAALEFADQSRTARDSKALLNILRRSCAHLGIDRMARLPFLVPGDDPAIGAIVGDTDPEWVEHYNKADFVHHDVSLVQALRSTEPCTWSASRQQCNSRAQSDVYSAAAEFGMAEGLVVPIHHRRGAVHGVVFAGRDFEAGPDVVAYLHLIAVHFNSALDRFELAALGETRRALDLTERQIECLRWVAAGKTDWEIGEILRISERTVHHHIERAKTRLDVRTRIQAVMELVDRRILPGSH